MRISVWPESACSMDDPTLRDPPGRKANAMFCVSAHDLPTVRIAQGGGSMTPIVAGIAVVAMVLAGTAQPPTPAEGAGKRVETESYTGPKEVARCIAYNISKKMPELRVRSSAAETPDDRGYLVLTTSQETPATFGVIRIDRSAEGTHLTTWLPERSLSAAPEVIARKLVAGC